MAALDSSGLTQLHLACGTFDLDWTKELLEKGADANAVMLKRVDGHYEADSKMSPLFLLIERGNTCRQGPPPDFMDLLQLLIGQGADVNIACKSVTPLYYVYSKRIKSKGMPPKNNRDIYMRDITFGDRITPFPYLEVADLLLKSQKSYNTNPTSEDGFSHFHYACLRNDVEMAKQFLDNGAIVNQITSPFLDCFAGFSSLHFAFVYQSDKIIPLLIESGADVKAEDAHGNTPLHYAIIYNCINLQLFDRMLSQGANINAKNVAGETPLHCLLNQEELTLENVGFFTNRAATIDVSESESMVEIFDTAIRNSTANDVVSIYKTLLKACVLEPDISRSFNAIHSIVAVYDEGRKLDFYLDTIRQFLDLGFELNWQKEYDYNFDKMPGTYLESGLHWLSKYGATALHRATANYVDAAVEALLILGANPNIVDEAGRAPLCAETYYDCLHEEPFMFIMTKRTIEILVAHVWKMELIQLDVTRSFSEAVDRAMTYHGYSVDETFKRTCQNELMKIENTTIGKVVPLRNFLSEWGAVIDYPMMPFAHRELVDEYFTDADGLRKEFPEFCGLLMLQYRKALDRVQLLRSAKYVIVSECEIELPNLCLEAIFIYFKNDDLRILIADSDEVLHPCKRQKI